MNRDIHGKMPNNHSWASENLGYMADPRYGFSGTIHTEEECKAVGGNFSPQLFGWMVHVYPFASDDFKGGVRPRRPAIGIAYGSHAIRSFSVKCVCLFEANAIIELIVAT